MKIVAQFSFNDGDRVVNSKYPALLKEITQIITDVDATTHKNKVSKEKTMKGQKLYAPREFNKTFKKFFGKKGWKPVRVKCEYDQKYYIKGYKPPTIKGVPFREMDFIKEKLGVELQFGKYSFMVYNVCAKMTIFRNLDHIDTGIEIVPVKHLAAQMSSGVSYFEQFAWDLSKRGVADIDIPVLILGIDV